MPNSVDINLFTIYRQGGQDRGQIPGLKVAPRPRRTARSRDADQLLIYLTLSGNLSLPQDQQDKIMSDLARTYYDTSGSVTSAMRVTAEALNELLMRRNLQSTGSNQQVIGLLTLLVLRGGQIYLSQSGPVRAYILAGGQVQHLYDPQLSGKGLGLGQSTPLRYFQATFVPGDILLLAAQQPPGVRIERVTALAGQTAEIQRQRLSEIFVNLEPMADLNAVFVQVQAGAGKFTLAPFPFTPATQKPAPVSQPPGLQKPGFTTVLTGSAPVTDVVQEYSAAGFAGEQEDMIAEADLLADHFQPLPELGPVEAPFPPEASEAVSVSSVRVPEPAVSPAAPVPVEPKRTKKPGFLRLIGNTFGRFLARLLPEESIASIPNSVMAIMALVIPMVIVAVSTAVYFRRGLDAQAELVYQQANEAAKLAQVQAEPIKRYEALNASMRLLDAADSYSRKPQTQGLRLEVQRALDELDLVKRLDYRPAIVGGLSDETQITQIVPVDNDLYLLDRRSGSVLRAFLTDQGYQVDPNFACGPNATLNVGPLVDLNAWPVGVEPIASVAGIDSSGNLLFCSFEGPAQSLQLADPPNLGMEEVTGFAVNLNDLYVLDPTNQAVWVYWSGDFENPPTSYFGDQPLPVKDVIDLMATSEEVYLLHDDGRMMLCFTSNLGAVSPTRCTDPVPYLDTRPGRENTSFNLAVPYTQMQYNPPPDPSLFLLVSKGQAVDRFSLRNLAFQRRFMPASALIGGEAQAIAIDPVERTIYLAVGNQVYYASLP